MCENAEDINDPHRQGDASDECEEELDVDQDIHQYFTSRANEYELGSESESGSETTFHGFSDNDEEDDDEEDDEEEDDDEDDDEED